MKIVVTGAAGFIGSALIRRLMGKYIVTGIDTAPRDSWPETPSYKIEGAIEDLEDLTPILTPGDVVFHFGSPNDVRWCDEHPDETVRSSVYATERLLNAAHTARARVVLPTTSAIYDRRAYGFYATSKKCCEALARAWEARGLQIAICRYWNVYGPGQRANAVVPRFVRSAVRGEPITVYDDDDKNGRDFVHVDDVNAFHEKLLTHWAGGEHCIGSKQVTSVRALAELATELAGGPPPVIVPRPKTIERPSWPANYGWPYGWRPTVLLRDGLRELIEAEATALRAGVSCS